MTELQLTLTPKESSEESELKNVISNKLKVNINQISHIQLVKKSIDSRDKANILFIYSVDVDLKDKNVNILKPNPVKHRAKWVEPFVYEIKTVPENTGRKRPIIVGTGPAGLFAGLALAKA